MTFIEDLDEQLEYLLGHQLDISVFDTDRLRMVLVAWHNIYRFECPGITPEGPEAFSLVWHSVDKITICRLKVNIANGRACMSLPIKIEGNIYSTMSFLQLFNVMIKILRSERESPRL